MVGFLVPGVHGTSGVWLAILTPHRYGRSWKERCNGSEAQNDGGIAGVAVGGDRGVMRNVGPYGAGIGCQDVKGAMTNAGDIGEGEGSRN